MLNSATTVRSVATVEVTLIVVKIARLKVRSVESALVKDTFKKYVAQKIFPSRRKQTMPLL